MEELRAIVTRLPDRELEIRRLTTRDPQFRAICHDYQEAAAALDRWRQAAGAGLQPDDLQVRDYERLLTELEAEILAELQGSTGRTGSR